MGLGSIVSVCTAHVNLTVLCDGRRTDSGEEGRREGREHERGEGSEGEERRDGGEERGDEIKRGVEEEDENKEGD